MNHPLQRSGPSQDRGDDRRSTPVSPLMVPLLFVGLLIGFVAGYFFIWWGLIAVAAVLIASVAMVLRGKSRDGATGAITGVLLGYVGIMLVALFRGVL